MTAQEAQSLKRWMGTVLAGLVITSVINLVALYGWTKAADVRIQVVSSQSNKNAAILANHSDRLVRLETQD